ncbi:MAG TPA: hypothetical protein VFM31_02640 [Nitrososphaeraceae archaeon]|nr:hypothetical protein [Nitrososphaeraceae archaeon]
MNCKVKFQVNFTSDSLISGPSNAFHNIRYSYQDGMYATRTDTSLSCSNASY